MLATLGMLLAVSGILWIMMVVVVGLCFLAFSFAADKRRGVTLPEQPSDDGP